ncbi:hypothetical protein P781_05075 [Vibrio mimicus CAIM 1883]|nr:hypothetical protein P781_05075 [Vibrio mimicus CAIM 1883]
MEHTNNAKLDFAGVGVGPFNLSIAALLADKPQISARFFESRDHFSWHPGLLLDNTHMQTMFLKDLVSAVNPESRYSFISYLVKNKKFYRFLSAELKCISRHEFSDYLAWVAHQLDNVQFQPELNRWNTPARHSRSTPIKALTKRKISALAQARFLQYPNVLKHTLVSECSTPQTWGYKSETSLANVC